MIQLIFESEIHEQLRAVFKGFFFWLSTDPSWHEDIFQRCELGEEPMKLEDEANVLIAECSQIFALEPVHICGSNAKGARVGGIQRTQDLEQGGFSSP